MATTKLQLRVSLLLRSFHLLNSLSFQKNQPTLGNLKRTFKTLMDRFHQHFTEMQKESFVSQVPEKYTA